jgi:hypothetical protein
MGDGVFVEETRGGVIVGFQQHQGGPTPQNIVSNVFLPPYLFLFIIPEKEACFTTVFSIIDVRKQGGN